MRRVYLLILALAAMTAGLALAGWPPHPAGGAALTPVETPQRAAAQQQDCVDDVSVTVNGVSDIDRTDYGLNDPPDYAAGARIAIYYTVTNTSCGEVTVTVVLTGSVSEATIHDADGSLSPCSDGCTIPTGSPEYGTVQWDLSKHPNANGEKVIATITVTAPDGFVDANPDNNSATSAQSINIVNEEPDPAPDIAVKSVTPSVSEAVVGNSVDFTVTVQNEGDADAETTVILDQGADTDELASETVSVLANGTEKTVTLVWDTNGAKAGEHTLRALAQTEGDGKADNDSGTASVTLLEPSVDAAVKSVTASATEALVGDTITFTVTLENAGNVPAPWPQVSLFDASAAADADPLASKTADTSISVGGELTVAILWDTSETEAGDRNLRVLAQTRNDDNPDNDSATISLTLHNPVDVGVSFTDATASPAVSGATAEIGFTLNNTGDHDTGEVTVSLYVTAEGEERGEQEPAATTTVSTIAAGDTATGTLDWDTADVAVGHYDLEVVIQTTGDTDATNNSASSASIEIRNWLTVKNVSPTGVEIVTGDTIEFTAQAENVGSGEVTGVTVGLYPSKDDAALADVDFASIAAGGTADATIEWSTAGQDAGQVHLFVIAGADGQVPDGDDSQTVNVIIRNPIMLVSATPASEDNIAGLPVSINVEVRNESVAEVTGVEVTLDVVGDCENEEDEEKELKIGCATIAAIPAGETGTAVLEWDTAGVAAGQHDLKVIASAAGYSSDTNDELPLPISLRDPVVAVALTEATINRDLAAIGQTLDVVATIANNGEVPVAAPVTLYRIQNHGGEKRMTEVSKNTSPLIEPGSSEEVTLLWDTTGKPSGEYDLKVSVDLPDDTTPDDNTSALTAELFPSAFEGDDAPENCREDVRVKVTGVSGVNDFNGEKRSPPDYQVGEQLRATYSVYNFSCQTDITPALTMSGPQDHAISDAAALCFSDCVIPFGGKADGEIVWTIPTLPALSDQPISASVTVVSPSDFVDADEANNSAQSTDRINVVHPADVVLRLGDQRGNKVSTRQSLTGPEFGTVDVRLVSAEPLQTAVPFAAATVQVAVEVANDGSTREPAAVRFLWKQQELSSHAVVIPAGQTKLQSLHVPVLKLPPGAHTIEVLLSAAVDQSRENNTASVEITRLEPLVEVDMVDVAVSPTVLILGDEATVSLSVRNESEIALPLSLELYVDDDAEPIGTKTIEELAPDGQSEGQIAWRVPASARMLGQHTLTLMASSDDFGAVASTDIDIAFHIDAEVLRIKASPDETVMQGEEVAIEVAVRNNGPATVSVPVTLRFPSAMKQPETRKPSVPAESTETARFTWKTRDYAVGDHMLTAAVPEQHNIAGGRTSMELPFRVSPLAVTATIVDVSAYPETPSAGEPVSIAVTVRNDGPVATRIPVTLHFPSGGRQPDSRKPHLDPGETGTVVFEWRTGNYRPGTHRFRIEVAAVDAPRQHFTIDLLPTAENVAIVDMGTYPVETAMVGEPVEVWVEVRNDGPVALNVPVQLTFPSASKRPAVQSPRVDPGETARVSFDWKTANYEPGIHTLRAAILLDSNLTLGLTSEEIRFVLTPLVINATIVDVAINPEEPSVGEPVTITATVRNDGRIAANIPVTLHFPTGDKQPEMRRPRVAPGAVGSASFEWRTGRYEPGIHDFRVEVASDPPASQRFEVELLLPIVDVAIVGMGADPSDSAVHGQEVKVWVDVINNGASAINVPVQLTFPSAEKKPEEKSLLTRPGETGRIIFVWKTSAYEPGFHTLDATIDLAGNVTQGSTYAELQFLLTPSVITATVLDISANPEAPRMGEPVTITVTVRNDGPVAANIPVTLRFPSDDKQPETRRPRVEPGATGEALFTWRTGRYPPGDHQFVAEVASIPLSTHEFTVTLLPPLVSVTVLNMGSDPAGAAMVGQSVKVWVEVRNDGPVAMNIPVQLTASSSNVESQTRTARVQPGETARVEFTWKTSDYEPGAHTLEAAVQLPENVTEGKTSAELQFLLTPSVITATVLDISASPEAPRVGEPVTITVTVRNDGIVAANIPVTLRFPSDDKQPETRSLRIDPGATGTIAFTWRTGRYEPGMHDFRLEVASTPPATREFTVELLPPIVNVAIVGMGSDPSESAVKGQVVKIWVDVINNGPSALNVPVQLAFPSDEKRPERNSTRIEPGQTARVEFTWKTSNYGAGEHLLTATLMAERNITELATSATLQIRLVSPRLAASIVDISWRPASPVIGEPVSITVAVRNNGSVAANIPVTLYFPSGNRQPQTKRPRVAPGAVGSADFTWRTSRYEPGDHLFRVQIPGVAGAARTFEIELRPPEVDFAVADFRTPDPLHPIVKGDWVEITVIVQNQGPYAGRGTVYLLNGDNPDAMYEQSASLEPGEFREVEFTWKTLRYPVGEYDLTVRVEAEHDADPDNDESDPARVRLLTDRDITVGFGNVARPAVFAEPISEVGLLSIPRYHNDISVVGNSHTPVDRPIAAASDLSMGVSPEPAGRNSDPVRMYWRWRSAQISQWECARYQRAIGESLPRAVMCPKAPALVR